MTLSILLACAFLTISTHTLTWSVTDSREQKWGHIEISTHTLTWSVTPGLCVAVRCPCISTHTLTWSVTGGCVEYYSDVLDFNSHAHVERDGRNSGQFHERANFNSHAHVERDLLNLIGYYLKHISTHTLTWSVTKVNH